MALAVSRACVRVPPQLPTSPHSPHSLPTQILTRCLDLTTPLARFVCHIGISSAASDRRLFAAATSLVCSPRVCSIIVQDVLEKYARPSAYVLVSVVSVQVIAAVLALLLRCSLRTSADEEDESQGGDLRYEDREALLASNRYSTNSRRNSRSGGGSHKHGSGAHTGGGGYYHQRFGEIGDI